MTVQRWDVYDAADHLDDLPAALYQAMRAQDWGEVEAIADALQEWTDRLWAMSAVGGRVGPYPFYVNQT